MIYGLFPANYEKIERAIEAALSYYAMACNCGSVCTGTCTQAILLEARDLLKNEWIPIEEGEDE